MSIAEDTTGPGEEVELTKGHADAAALTAPPEAVDDSAAPEDAEGAVSAGAGPAALGAPTLAAALEALLLVSESPQTPLELAQFLQRPTQQVDEELQRLAEQYREQGRGFELRNTDSGWRFYTSPACRDLMTRYVTDGRQAKLSQAALETLAIVAYRQPVTRGQVGAVRGVNPDGVMKTLLARGLIAEVDDEGPVAHFVTTPYFLDRMGLASLADLPPIADHLPDLDSLDDLID